VARERQIVTPGQASAHSVTVQGRRWTLSSRFRNGTFKVGGNSFSQVDYVRATSGGQTVTFQIYASD